MKPTGIEAEVCKDIAKRQRRGIAKYGVTVANNPLSLDQWLQHAYEECLDQAVYLKRAIKAKKSAEREADFYRNQLELIRGDLRRTKAKRLADSALVFWDAIKVDVKKWK